MTHSILASIRAKSGRSSALGRALLDLVAPSRAEEGFLRYDILQSKNDDECWIAFEEWRSEKDFEKHFQQTYMTDFVSRLPELAEGDLDFRGYTRHSDAPESADTRGRALLRRIGGEGWDGPITALALTSPAFADLTVSFPYGDVLSRPGLDLRTRQFAR